MSENHTNRLGAIHRELHSHLPSEPALRVKALESLLVEKGLLDPRTVDAWIEVYTEEIGPEAWRRGCGTGLDRSGLPRQAPRRWNSSDYRDRLRGLGRRPPQGRSRTPGGSQPRRLHALLVLPACCPRHPAQLVQDRRLPFTRGARPARCDRRVRRGHSRRRGGSCLGLDRRGPLPRTARAARRHRGLGRRSSRRPRHSQLHDRHRARPRATRRGG